MYQALYRKWRPKTFADVIGQPHITETLRKQVEEGRTSHAYLFTGTRGTGKTTCAKILARAVNCEHPAEGDPCNQCGACLGLESGGFLDVLELDAASNNGVDQVRALRDEAIYSPAHVKKRVYIIDEVHMLSTPAFNALLKILEEPPEHLMFILATTELHKVPATILSRCQRFSFKRITPADVAKRLSYVAEQEKIDLTPDGAELLGRLADGALRDGLSLLDQCAAAGGTVDAGSVLEALGLAGNLQTAQLMECILARDAKAALLLLNQLYEDGKDVGAILGELYYSANRRTDAELCLLRLCDESLSGDLTALDARIRRLEEAAARGQVIRAAVEQSAAARKREPPEPKTEDAAGGQESAAPPAAGQEDLPPWDEPPLPEEPGARTFDIPEELEPPAPAGESRSPQLPAAVPQDQAVPVADGSWWRALAESCKGRLPPMYRAFLDMCGGVLEGDQMTVYAPDDITLGRLENDRVRGVLSEEAERAAGTAVRLAFRVGEPPKASPQENLKNLLKFGSQFDNITIK